mmetsp:Transcript_20809/g.32107  ORF Transcript_20809/g.32107 Transcript_20809/m.32107 type:complete len:198 (+) Transcript_20809:933-1526(+)
MAKLEEEKRNKLKEEEEQFQKVLEQSKNEEELMKSLRIKNEVLLKEMAAIEENKPSGWGLEQKKVDIADPNAFEDLQNNIHKAIKQLEAKDKLKSLGQEIKEEQKQEEEKKEEEAPKKKPVEDLPKVEDILEMTNDGSETAEERQKRLLAHKQKLVELRDKERQEQENMMRQSLQNFKNLKKDEISAEERLKMEAQI